MRNYSEIDKGNKYGTDRHKPTRTQLHLLDCIDEAGKDDICRSEQAFTDDPPCSPKTIERGTAHLCALGLIEGKPGYLSIERQAANIYCTCESAQEEVRWYCPAAERAAERV